MGMSLVPLKLDTIEKLLWAKITSEPLIMCTYHMLFVIAKKSNELMTDWTLELWLTMCQQVRI